MIVFSNSKINFSLEYVRICLRSVFDFQMRMLMKEKGKKMQYIMKAE